MITSCTLGNVRSFQNLLKTYYIWPYEFQDYREASVAIESAFTGYNEVRTHSSIDYPPPWQFRWKLLNDKSYRGGYVRKLDVKISEK